MEEGTAIKHKGEFLCSDCMVKEIGTEPRERFEYKIEAPRIRVAIVDILNKNGAEGWELVDISPNGTLTFKRRYVE